MTKYGLCNCSKDAPKADVLPLAKAMPLAPGEDDILLTQAFRTPWKPPSSHSQAQGLPHSESMGLSQSKVKGFSLSQMSGFTQNRANINTNSGLTV
jgi:hypothetical protein